MLIRGVQIEFLRRVAVLHRPHRGEIARRTGNVVACGPEVDQNRFAILVEKYVVRRNIAMQNACLVDELDRIQQLQRDPFQRRRIDGSAMTSRSCPSTKSIAI